MAAEPVDLELVLAVDVSGSIDSHEAGLQRNGYLAAITDDRVIAAIGSGRLGRIAIAYFEWGGAKQQNTLVPWQIIDDKSSAIAFATALKAAPRTLVANRTSIGSAIVYALPMFTTNDFESPRQVIDISGDGPNNSGERADAARDLAINAGVTINGLPVVNDRPNRFGLPSIPDLDRYYASCVIGGPSAFLVVANTFQDFAAAILRKFIIEIAAVPFAPPVSAPLFHTMAANTDLLCGVGERRFQKYFGK
ncbi:MAG: DUF1194 domain-containing protein [Alphaproteobacteria bacterium]